MQRVCGYREYAHNRDDEHLELSVVSRRPFKSTSLLRVEVRGLIEGHISVPRWPPATTWFDSDTLNLNFSVHANDFVQFRREDQRKRLRNDFRLSSQRRSSIVSSSAPVARHSCAEFQPGLQVEGLSSPCSLLFGSGPILFAPSK